MAISKFSRWKKAPRSPARKMIAMVLLSGVIFSLLFIISNDEQTFWASSGIGIAFIILLSTIQQISNKEYFSLPSFKDITNLKARQWGMITGHTGFAILIIGIVLVNGFSQYRQVRMSIGENLEVGTLQFEFNKFSKFEGANYTSQMATFIVRHSSNNSTVTINTEKRYYPVQGTYMTEAGIDSSLLRDVYISMGNNFEDNSFAVMIFIKPFMSWIWIGALLVAFGGLLSINFKLIKIRFLSTGYTRDQALR